MFVVNTTNHIFAYLIATATIYPMSDHLVSNVYLSNYIHSTVGTKLARFLLNCETSDKLISSRRFLDTPMKALPQPQIILDYSLVYNTAPPIDRISIVAGISRDALLFELAGLNYRLKPTNQLRVDSSFETQVKELKYFTKTEKQFLKYSGVASRFTKSEEDFPIIFTRQTCVFALEEIVNSERIKNIDGFEMGTVREWESLLDYILAVNYAITQVQEEEAEGKPTLESLNPKLLPLNELNIETDMILTPYRGYKLIAYFLSRPQMREHVIAYFKDVYGVEPEKFIFIMMNMYLGNSNAKDPLLNFFYQVDEENDKLFHKMSFRVSNVDTYKLLSIRKSPFIKVGDGKYLITDNAFLLDKCYSQLINDVWFDKIKDLRDFNNKPLFTIDKYRSDIGYFFEQYISEILKACFSSYKYSVLRVFDELKIPTANGNVEIADVYLRYGNKILLCQAKSGSIYDKEKYGGTIESLYKTDRGSFFKNFGVDQLFESIAALNNNGSKIDERFPKGKTLHIYPCIIVNDKALQTPLMADIFNKRFQEILVGFDQRKIKVKKLSLIHISDLERLVEHLEVSPEEIWSLLDSNCKNKFIPPFYFTINTSVHTRGYRQKVLDLFQDLILKYNPENKE